MKCPHCLDSYHSRPIFSDLSQDSDFYWRISYELCPSCGKIIIFLHSYYGGALGQQNYRYLLYPKVISRSPISPDVPPNYSRDYKEACLVINDSPKASAALSRRCLQQILREKARVKPCNLSSEIDEVINSKQLPTYLSDGLDAIRNIGNFAAHPLKSTNTGEIVDVESGEAEWSLEILESLFDFYFVQPEALKKKREALNEKLKDVGKPSMKQ